MCVCHRDKSMRGSSCSKKNNFSKTSPNVEISSFRCFGGLKKIKIIKNGEFNFESYNPNKLKQALNNFEI